jgi:hypothetical protein
MKRTSPSRADRDEAVVGNEVPRCKVRTLIDWFGRGKSMAILYIGIDLDKNVFAVHGMNEAGKPV